MEGNAECFFIQTISYLKKWIRQQAHAYDKSSPVLVGLVIQKQINTGISITGNLNIAMEL